MSLYRGKGGPGGMTLVSEIRKLPNQMPTRAQLRSMERKGEWNREHPALAEGGVYLNARQVYRKIVASRVVTEPKDADFMETIEDMIGAHAEVGRRFIGTHAQAQRLSDIYRRAEAT